MHGSRGVSVSEPNLLELDGTIVMYTVAKKLWCWRMSASTTNMGNGCDRSRVFSLFDYPISGGKVLIEKEKEARRQQE